MSVPSPLSAPPVGHGIELGRRPQASRRAGAAGRARSAVAYLALGGVLACAAVIGLAGGGTAAILPASIQPVPSSLAGPLGSLGVSLRSGPLILTFAAMFACYVTVVRLAERLDSRLILACVAGVMAIVMLAPPLFSTDVFSYQAYARMWTLYGVNPYLHGPHAIMLDPIYPYIGDSWVVAPSAYGPVFTLLSGAFASLSVAAAVLAYRALAAASCLACVWFVLRAAKLRGVHQGRSAALVGLNPLLAMFGVGGSHNDLLMLAAVCAGVYFALAARARAGGAAITLAAAVKLNGALLLPFMLADGWRNRAAAPRRRGLLTGVAVVAAAALVASAIAFGSGTLHLPNTLLESQAAGDWHSIPGFLFYVLGLGHVGSGPRYALGAASLAAVVWLLREVAGGRLDWVDGAAWGTLAVLVSASALLPWYVSWLLPLVALSSDRRLWRCALWLSGVVLALQIAGYLPHNDLIRAL